MTRSGKIVNQQSRLMGLANFNITNHETKYFVAMMKIFVLQTDGKERETMDYVQSKEFACVEAGI